MKIPFAFNATVLKVIDGDSIRLSIDRGWSDYSTRDTRLVGINARELHQPGGPEAQAHLASMLPVGSAVVLTSIGVDKYGGRVLAKIGADFGDVSDKMVADGYAAVWDGNGPKPVPAWPLAA